MANHNVNHKTIKLINSLKGKRKIRILFVCLGNICRSPAAEEIMRSLINNRKLSDYYDLDSAGFYGGHAGEMPDRRMRIHAIRRGYDLTHRSRKIYEYDFNDFDIIIGMDYSNYDDLIELAPTLEDQEKVFRMIDFARNHPYQDSIPDPYYGGSEGFELVLDVLEDSCSGLLDEIEKIRTAK